jgi:hypothetical protein
VAQERERKERMGCWSCEGRKNEIILRVLKMNARTRSRLVAGRAVTAAIGKKPAVAAVAAVAVAEAFAGASTPLAPVLVLEPEPEPVAGPGPVAAAEIAAAAILVADVDIRPEAM